MSPLRSNLTVALYGDILVVCAVLPVPGVVGAVYESLDLVSVTPHTT